MFCSYGARTSLGLGIAFGLVHVFGIRIAEALVQGLDGRGVGVGTQRRKVVGKAYSDVFLGEVVLVDEDFADLIGGVGVFAPFGVVIVQ